MLASIKWIFTYIIFLLFSVCANADNQTNDYELKNTQPIHFVYADKALISGKYHQKGEKIAEEAAFFIATKTNTVMDGPFTYVFPNVEGQHFGTSTQVSGQLGWPVKTAVTLSGNYNYRVLPAIKCLTFLHEGPSSDVPKSFKRLYEEAVKRNLTPTGEARAVIKLSSNTGYVVSELQLGIQ